MFLVKKLIKTQFGHLFEQFSIGLKKKLYYEKLPQMILKVENLHLRFRKSVSWVVFFCLFGSFLYFQTHSYMIKWNVPRGINITASFKSM